MYLPDFLDGFDRLVAFDAETTGKRTPDAEFIRKQPFAWRAPGIIIEVGFVEMLREGGGWRNGETWSSRVKRHSPIRPTPGGRSPARQPRSGARRQRRARNGALGDRGGSQARGAAQQANHANSSHPHAIP